MKKKNNKNKKKKNKKKYRMRSALSLSSIPIVAPHSVPASLGLVEHRSFHGRED